MALTKPIQDRIFKSRLTITYRTNITGTVQQEKLPYRLLVLGEFAGRSSRDANLLSDLAKRHIRSIKRGTSVNDHLSEVVPTWRIPANDPALTALRSAIPGHVTFDKVTCAIPLTALAEDQEKAFNVGGTATFVSLEAENGLCDISGPLHVSGSLSVKIADGVATPTGAKVSLHGALSGSYVDAATSKIVGVVTGLVEQQGIAIDVGRLQARPRDEVEAGEAPAEQRKVRELLVSISGPQAVDAERTIPFTSLDAFTPDAVAKSIPEVYRLRVVKRLLTELQTGLRNWPDVRKRLKDLLPAYGEPKDSADKKLAAIRELKAWADESFALLKIDHGAGAPQDKAGGA
jgi:predicted component of type VI protein secretion system